MNNYNYCLRAIVSATGKSIRGLVIITLMNVVGLSLVFASNVISNVPNPVITGPVVCGQNGITCSPHFNLLGVPLPNGMPESSQLIHPEFAAGGYQEKEYFLEGTATGFVNKLNIHGSPAPLASDGYWSLVPNSTAHYKTRILVRSPIDPRKFNGTVLVEWANVTNNVDLDPIYAIVRGSTITENGYAFVLVSAQTSGVLGDQAFDPLRYGSLTIPGDDYSFDIFSQAAQAIKHPQGINPLAGLQVKKIIAVGQSQSALALTTYINGFQPMSKIFDGFLLSDHYSSGLFTSVAPGVFVAPTLSSAMQAPIPTFVRTDLRIPILDFESENAVAGDTPIFTGLNFDNYIARQPDTNTYRRWEVAGAPHVFVGEGNYLGLSFITNIPDALFGCSEIGNDGLVLHYVHDAALQDLTIWVNAGIMIAQPSPLLSVNPPAPSQPFLPILNVVQFDSLIGPDNLPVGIAKGGIRTPFVDVPINVESSKGNSLNTLICELVGRTIPYDSATLKALYPSHNNYVFKVINSTVLNAIKGFITPKDSLEIINNAINSNIGN